MHYNSHIKLYFFMDWVQGTIKRMEKDASTRAFTGVDPVL